MTKQLACDECNYEICLQGRLGNQLREWFPGLEASTIISGKETVTRLSGRVADQSVLLSILARIIDLNMPIISVQRISLKTE
jgi:hypothetical protein